LADKHGCGPHEAFRHVRYEAVEQIQALVFDLCNTLTHGREHLDVRQCAADALKRAKEFRSALVRTWATLDDMIACGVDSCCRESAVAARDEAADLVKPYQDVQ
jgi:FMN phosphatase YigB (HAD superfamily)